MCSSCGSEIPKGQWHCSMCYGDPNYGRDGYYQAWLDQEYSDSRREKEPRYDIDEYGHYEVT